MMCRGNYRRAIAVGMLSVCLLLAVPQATEARVLEPVSHDRVASLENPRQEMALWERLWSAFGTTWAKVSVLIDPSG